MDYIAMFQTFFKVVAFYLVASSANGAILQIDTNGELTGANGVLVSQSLYDVSFVDSPGSFSSLFLNGDADVIATNSGEGHAFSNALLREILINQDGHLFDSLPYKTLGCEQGGMCKILTPYAVTSNAVRYSVAYNSNKETIDRFGQGISSFTNNLGFRSDTTWAVWTKSIMPVPEPTSISLLSLGLLGLVFRRKNH